MNTLTFPAWTLNANQIIGIALYAALAPASLFLMSANFPGSQVLATVTLISTLPFWPLAAVSVQAASVLGNVLVFAFTAWAVTFLQAWIALILLHARAAKKGTSMRIELLGVIKRSAVLVLLVSAAVAAVLFWLAARP